jgi:hypothetical protein
MSAPVMTLFAMTDASGVTHLITDEAMTTGQPIGCYAAVCGDQVLAASLTTPERRYCRSCHQGKAGR